MTAPAIDTQALPFREVWLVDFEFSAAVGEPPRPICLVARKFGGERTIRIWDDELTRLAAPPYPVDHGSLFVSYYASAELSCHRVLGWPLPEHVLDLHAEFRALTNGRAPAAGAGLLGALSHFGQDALAGAEKDAMRQLALRGSPWTTEEREALLDYCASDVDALARLLPRMLPHIDLPRALLRGRYMRAAAIIECNGTPIDVPTLELLRENWAAVQDRLIVGIDADHRIFDGRTFKRDRWERWLAERGIPWPRLPSGILQLGDGTFREMARLHPEVAPIRELRHALSQLRLMDLAVGQDGRNRCLLSAFRARTGRNQPSNARFIFGPSVWLRSLIKPEPGMGLAYVDWSQQEFGIAAALSGDQAMIAAYTSGDPYWTFARQAGAIPADGTREADAAVCERFKQCALAVQYGMGAESLAIRIGQPVAEARALLALHRRTYPRFWAWSDNAVDHAMLHGWLQTVFGWRISVGADANPRFLRNFPMQANGAEMLRLACCLATERGIRVCAPVHDAILIEAPLERLDEAILAAQSAMREASEIVLDGFQLRTSVKPIRYPDRYIDDRGAKMWATVTAALESLTGQQVH